MHFDGPTISMEAFREKTRAFLRQHENDIAIHRLRMNKQLTAMDLTSLEQMLADSGIGDPAGETKQSVRALSSVGAGIAAVRCRAHGTCVFGQRKADECQHN